MAITIDPVDEIPSVIRDASFSEVISVTADAGEIIDRTTMAFSYADITASEEELTAIERNGGTLPTVTTQDPGITITPTPSSITIAGNYTVGFQDIIKHITKGSTITTETPTITIGFGNVPPNRDVFEINQDLTPKIDLYYEINVYYEDPVLLPGEEQVETFEIKHTIENNWSAATVFAEDYFDSKEANDLARAAAGA